MAEKVYLRDSEGRVTVYCPAEVYGRGFRHPRGTVTKAPVSMPLDLSEPERCYHTHEHTEEEVSGGFVTTKVRCSNPASQDGKHGWLCIVHLIEMRGAVAKLRFDAERQLIADILAVERAALKDCKRESINLGSNRSITYLVQ